MLIHTAAVAGLADIETRDGVLDIGAAATLDRAFAALDPRYPGSRPVAPLRLAAGTRVRNPRWQRRQRVAIGDSMPM